MSKLENIFFAIVGIMLLVACIVTTARLPKTTTSEGIDLDSIEIRAYTEEGEQLTQGYATLTINGDVHIYAIDE